MGNASLADDDDEEAVDEEAVDEDAVDEEAVDGEAVEEEGLTLEELSQSYHRVLEQAGDSQATATAGAVDSTAYRELAAADGASVGQQPTAIYDPLEEPGDEAGHIPVTPAGIIEAVLFVGRPDGGPVSAGEMANLMRGVEADEVAEHVNQLNAVYEETGRPMRIVAVAGGFRMQLADDLSEIRDRFYGRARHVKLNQAAIDCLALIAYQPGISREKLEEQRGQPSGGVLNQLVRRQLIDIRREAEPLAAAAAPPASGRAPGPKMVQRYYPTEKLCDLAGIASLDDLPHTEDF